MMRKAGALICALAFALPVHAQQTTTSYRQIYSSEFWGVRERTVQLFLCDNGADITSSDPAADGQVCSAGQWSGTVDCRGASFAALTVQNSNVAGGATISVSLHGALSWVGEVGSSANSVADDGTGLRGFTNAGGEVAAIAAPGVDDPAGTPSAADPVPFAVEITDSINGDGIKQAVISEGYFPFMMVRIDALTGTFTGSAHLTCRW